MQIKSTLKSLHPNNNSLKCLYPIKLNQWFCLDQQKSMLEWWYSQCDDNDYQIDYVCACWMYFKEDLDWGLDIRIHKSIHFHQKNRFPVINFHILLAGYIAIIVPYHIVNFPSGLIDSTLLNSIKSILYAFPSSKNHKLNSLMNTYANFMCTSWQPHLQILLPIYTQSTTLEPHSIKLAPKKEKKKKVPFQKISYISSFTQYFIPITKTAIV